MSYFTKRREDLANHVTERRSDIANYFSEWRLDLHCFINRHFDMFREPETGAFRALYLHIPGTSVEIYSEWRETYSAWDIERQGAATLIWLGRLETTLSIGHPRKAVKAS